MSVKAFCLAVKSLDVDYQFRGVFFIKEDQLTNREVPLEVVKNCLMSRFTFDEDDTGREAAKIMLDEELPQVKYFWVDPCAAMRIHSMPLPPTGTDSAIDAVMDMWLKVCEQFRVGPDFSVKALEAIEYESRFEEKPLLRCPICLNDENFLFLYRPDTTVGVRVKEGKIVYDKPEATETPEKAGITDIQCAECESLGKPHLYGYGAAPKPVSGGLGPDDDYR